MSLHTKFLSFIVAVGKVRGSKGYYNYIYNHVSISLRSSHNFIFFFLCVFDLETVLYPF